MARPFTTEQIILLRSNPCTYKVTEKQIHFTKEFKEVFYVRHQEGIPAATILSDFGYDPEILGTGRIEGLSYQINRTKRNGGCFHDGPRSSIIDEDNPEVTAENFRRMQHEIRLLRQEMEFVKKISSAKESGR